MNSGPIANAANIWRDYVGGYTTETCLGGSLGPVVVAGGNNPLTRVERFTLRGAMLNY